MLSELIPNGGQQTDLLGYSSICNRSDKLMKTVNNIKKKYHRSTIHLASEGVERNWLMRRNFKSQDYKGDWNELPVVS